MCGCVQTKNVMQPSSINKISSRLQRLKIVFNYEHQKLNQQLSKLQKNLIEEFEKPFKNRILISEKAMINRNTYLSNIKKIYLKIENEAHRLYQYKGLLSQDNNISIILPSIDFIVYCSFFIKNKDLEDFARQIELQLPLYKRPNDDKIEDKLVRYYRYTQEASSQMQYEYIMELCINNNLDLQRINQIGHNYRYGIINQQ